MIVGIGTDIIEIERFDKSSKNQFFLKKIYTDAELEILGCLTHRLAGNFAAKEAVSKLLGTGFSSVSPKEIEILRNDKGKPYCILYGNGKKISENLGIKNIFISISHSKYYACATAVAEKE